MDPNVRWMDWCTGVLSLGWRDTTKRRDILSWEVSWKRSSYSFNQLTTHIYHEYCHRPCSLRGYLQSLVASRFVTTYTSHTLLEVLVSLTTWVRRTPVPSQVSIFCNFASKWHPNKIWLVDLFPSPNHPSRLPTLHKVRVPWYRKCRQPTRHWISLSSSGFTGTSKNCVYLGVGLRDEGEGARTKTWYRQPKGSVVGRSGVCVNATGELRNQDVP